MNRRQLLAKALKGQIRLMELQKKYNWDRNTLLSAVVLLDDPLPFTLHFTAFMAVIEAQGTDEQRQEWIPPSERMEISGIHKEISR
jgi:acyl-CoA oxidase